MENETDQEMEWHPPFFISKLPNGEEVRCCPRCWQGKKKKSYVVESPEMIFKCQVCDWKYTDPNRVPGG